MKKYGIYAAIALVMVVVLYIVIRMTAPTYTSPEPIIPGTIGSPPITTAP